jgi:putative oxidoreductase
MGDDFGKLVGRLVLGVLILFHGVHKLLNGIDPVKHLVTGHHLPAALSYGVYVGELAAPILIVLGLFSRVGGALVVINMLVALYLTHVGSLLAMNDQGGYALELQMFYLFGGLGVALLGAGRFSLGGADGPLN